MNRHGKKRVEAFLDMTPLIDVVFLLLIFFMVATTFDDFSGFKLKLPTSSSITETSDEKLSIVITEDKVLSILISDTGEKKHVKELDKSQLSAELNGLEGRFDTVTLAADGGIDYQYIVDIMTISKEAGIPNINIKTKN